MNWKAEIKGFESYLKLERSLSKNSVSAYVHDVNKLADFLAENDPKRCDQVQHEDLVAFIVQLNKEGINARSQARITSGLRGFFKYLYLEKLIDHNPAELLELPKIGRKLPDTLSIAEVDEIISTIDLSKPTGTRNKAILEVLYGCGLRVSELVELLITGLHLEEGYINVIGKGDKERLVPIGGQTIRHLSLYLETDRKHISAKSGFEDHVFLNKHGRKLSRMMIFTIIKDLCASCGIKKNVSPHTFRHSFATHMVQAGADLRAVQEMLGHESITTTEIYAHLDRDYLRSAIVEFHPLEKK